MGIGVVEREFEGGHCCDERRKRLLELFTHFAAYLFLAICPAHFLALFRCAFLPCL